MTTPAESFLDHFFAIHGNTSSSDQEFEATLAHYADPNYDPQKAKAYYERTKNLKGRRRGTKTDPESSGGSNGPRPSAQPAPSQPDSDQHAAARARREEVQRQVENLQERLSQLKEVLRQLTDAAKKKAGVETEAEKDKKKDSKDEKESKLTQAEKDKKAKAEKERRDKEKKDSPTEQLASIQQQIADVQEKIQQAREDLRDAIKKAQAKSDSSTSSGRQTKDVVTDTKSGR